MYTFQNLTAASKKLALIAEGLRRAAGGEAVERAATKVRDLVDHVAQKKLSAHSESGAAAGNTRVDVSGGGMVLLHGMPPCHGKGSSGKSYVSRHSWWPFRRGMPTSIVKQASRILAAEFLALVRSGAAPAGLLGQGEAEEVEAEGAAADAKKAATQTAKNEKKAARKAERKAQTEKRRADRKAERSKQREDREV